MRDKNVKRIILYFCYGVSAIFLGLPIISLFLSPWINAIKSLRDTLVIHAILISFKSTFFSLIIIIIFGLPTAFVMARYSFKGKRFLEIIFDLPLVLPPAVAGLLLLITFGRNGILGKYLYLLGIQIPFSFIAVVMAQVFVAGSIFIKSVKNALEQVDKDLEITAATLGDTPWQVFKRVTLPLSWNGILTGAVMAWARSLAEFGATIMFAGNLLGKTQTLPLAIYTAMERDMNLSMAIAVVLVVISLGILILLKVISQKS
ncbi:ABC transporter permease [Clostridium sediminicola]|uniref:ABC transporter permease n=1 Tax=Clostridium sediminicola TaxID=3114879 RepID=UPI0031F1D717